MWYSLKSLLTPRNKKQAIPQYADPVNENFHPAASPFDIRNGGTEGSVSVGTSAVELKAGANVLSHRRTLYVHVMGNEPIYWGFSSTVTANSGSPLLPGNTYCFKCDPTQAVSIYAIAGSSQDVRVVETN